MNSSKDLALAPTDRGRRLFYVDALRCLAIILVVLGHIVSWRLVDVAEPVVENSILFAAISNFHMPFFMMISGYVTKFATFKLNHRLRLLIPYFCFGFLYLFLAHQPYTNLFLMEMKAGYWYLYLIVIYCIVLALIRFCKIPMLLGMVLFEVLFIVLFKVNTPEVTNILTGYRMLWLWPYFCCGILLQKFDFSKVKYPILCGILLFLTFIISFTFLEVGIHVPAFGLVGTFSICIGLFFIFYGIEKKTGIENREHNLIERGISLIGSNTLQIYVMHNILIKCTPLYGLIKSCSSFASWVDWIIAPFVAIVVSLTCILIAQILYKLHLGFVFGR